MNIYWWETDGRTFCAHKERWESDDLAVDGIASLVRSRHISMFVHGSRQSYILVRLPHSTTTKRTKFNYFSTKWNWSRNQVQRHTNSRTKTSTFSMRNGNMKINLDSCFHPRSSRRLFALICSLLFLCAPFIVAFPSHRLVHEKFAEQFVAGADGRFT